MIVMLSALMTIMIMMMMIFDNFNNNDNDIYLILFHIQAKQLIHERWNDNIRIENNISEQTIVLHYWR